MPASMPARKRFNRAQIHDDGVISATLMPPFLWNTTCATPRFSPPSGSRATVAAVERRPRRRGAVVRDVPLQHRQAARAVRRIVVLHQPRPDGRRSTQQPAGISQTHRQSRALADPSRPRSSRSMTTNSQPGVHTSVHTGRSRQTATHRRYPRAARASRRPEFATLPPFPLTRALNTSGNPVTALQSPPPSRTAGAHR